MQFGVGAVVFPDRGEELPVLFFDGFGTFFHGGSAIVPVLLEPEDFTTQTAEGADDAEVLVEVGFEISGFDEQFGEGSGSELETDFRKLAGVLFAEEIHEGILANAVFEDVFLIFEPIEIAAAGPIGDVASGDGAADFIKGLDDVWVGGALGEHLVDEVALEFGEASDIAVAAMFAGFGFEGEWSGGG
jgi:hypothetical protein